MLKAFYFKHFQSIGIAVICLGMLIINFSCKNRSSSQSSVKETQGIQVAGPQGADALNSTSAQTTYKCPLIRQGYSTFEPVGPEVCYNTCGLSDMVFDDKAKTTRTEYTTIHCTCCPKGTKPRSCAAKKFYNKSDFSEVIFKLPEFREVSVNNAEIQIPAGKYNKYAKGKCNQVWWSDLTFTCGGDGQWVKTSGQWDASGRCEHHVPDSPYIEARDRSL